MCQIVVWQRTHSEWTVALRYGVGADCPRAMKYSAPARINVTTAAIGRATCGVVGFGRAAQTRFQSSSGASTGVRRCESSKSSHSDIAASILLHQGRQTALQLFVRAIEPRRDGPGRAAQHLGDLLVR